MIQLNLTTGLLSRVKVVDADSILVNNLDVIFRALVARHVAFLRLGTLDKIAMYRGKMHCLPFSSRAYCDVLDLVPEVVEDIKHEISTFASKLHSCEKTLQFELTNIQHYLRLVSESHQVTQTEAILSNIDDSPTDCTSMYYVCNDMKNLPTFFQLVSRSPQLSSLVLDFSWSKNSLSSSGVTMDLLRGNKSLKNVTVRFATHFRRFDVSVLLEMSLQSITLCNISYLQFLDKFFDGLATNKSLKSLTFEVCNAVQITQKMLAAFASNKTLRDFSITSPLGYAITKFSDLILATETLQNITICCEPAKINNLEQAMQKNMSICSFQSSCGFRNLIKPFFDDICARNRAIMPKGVTSILLDIMLLALPVDLPPYVILDILDWIAPYNLASHNLKIQTIYKIQKSMRNSAEKRDNKIRRIE